MRMIEVQNEESYLVDYRRQQWLWLRNDTAAFKKRRLVRYAIVIRSQILSKNILKLSNVKF